MRKTISSILITVIMLANFLAPISVGLGDKKVEVRKNEVGAVDPISGDYNFKITPVISKLDTSVSIKVNITPDSETAASIITGATFLYLGIEIVDENNKPVKDEDGHSLDQDRLLSTLRNKGEQDLDILIKGLKPLTKYTINLTIKESLVSFADVNSMPVFTKLYTNPPVSFTTLESGATESEAVESGETIEMVNNDPMPECGVVGGGTVGGCIAQAIYYLIFVPSSFLFALAGTFFDNTFAYSINDASYRSTFVVEGWKVVRDFCNMFFIFVLLYVAFKTILGLGASKTKEMIVNVVIIGLLINFSLFATRVIIDASNILARVFYNSNTIKITSVEKGGDTSNIVAKADETGVLPLSAALVNKVDPQSLIINAKAVGDIPDKAGKVNASGITALNFIVITLLASAVNIVGLIVFLSVGLIFVARVVGLWFAMIVVPFTFFSYTVPAMQDLDMVGWKKWWPETLKLAFLAPVFIFFLYLILQFLEKGLNMVDAVGRSGLDLVVSVVVPFAFIMVLLWKAKDIAKTMSGKMGQSITNGVKAVGGLALGGAALGGAFLGRKVIGGALAGASNTKGAQERLKFNDKVEAWKTGGKIGAEPKWKDHAKTAGVYRWNPIAAAGANLNKAQKKSNDVDRARSESDTDIEKAGFKGYKWSELSAEQRNIVKDKVKLENNSKFMDEAEQKYRKDNGLDERDENGKLADLTSDDKEKIKNKAKDIAVDKFNEKIDKAAEGVNAFTRAFSKANTGSWDVRKLSDISSDKRASIFTKIPVGLIAAVATGVRGGIIKTAGLSHGTVKVEGNFLNDLKSVFKDSLKDLKVELPETSHDDGGKKVGHGSSDGGHH
jgi:hypothetical protein